MRKVIVYGFENGKLWMGYPTLMSWVYSFFCRGGMLTITPIKGFENYAYYPKVLHISFEYCLFTNDSLGETPLASVIIAEKIRTGNKIVTITPYGEGRD